MEIPPHNIHTADLVKLVINRARGKSHIKYGLVVRVDFWTSDMVDLYVLWDDGELFWCNSDSVVKLNDN